ncbi:MAG: pantetheine-phosphate adenylyltransferase [Erysipelotrichaceae bacterium]|nr:pantetheine-phosphate adenylyltransferase [Erysipelotrichaceae bacterium]MBQ4252204.1 pantetheine-phosphate adenylyltransferase [Erysipelotrichaceae bacterium]
MQRAIYAGSFDPITLGHLDIIERGSVLFDELIILLMVNEEKNSLFSMEERKKMIEDSTRHLKNVRVEIGDGLTVEVARSLDCRILLRGIRAVTDYEYELQLATANMTLEPEIETVFLVSKPYLSFLSSSTVKTIAKNHGDISMFVPENVRKILEDLYR